MSYQHKLNAQQELITSSGVKNSAKTSSSAARVTKSKRERDNTQQQQQQLPVIKLPPKTWYNLPKTSKSLEMRELVPKRLLLHQTIWELSVLISTHSAQKNTFTQKKKKKLNTTNKKNIRKKCFFDASSYSLLVLRLMAAIKTTLERRSDKTRVLGGGQKAFKASAFFSFPSLFGLLPLLAPPALCLSRLFCFSFRKKTDKKRLLSLFATCLKNPKIQNPQNPLFFFPLKFCAYN